MQTNDELPLDERINRSMNRLLFVANALAFPSIVFLHRDLGRRFAGPQALFGAIIVFFWPILDSRCDPMPMLAFFGLFIAMCIASRFAGLRRKASGDPVYRHYDGTPRLMGLLRWTDELRFKRFAEPVIVFIVGGSVGVISPLIATFLMASAIALAISVNANAFAHGERVEAMRDRVHEQKSLVERFRRAGGK